MATRATRSETPAAGRISRKVRAAACLVTAILTAFCMMPLPLAHANSESGRLATAAAPELQSASADDVQSIMEAMSTDDKVSQMIVPAMRTWDDENVTSLDDAPPLADALQKHKYGGIILYGANVSTAGQVARLTSALQANNAQVSKVPYLMCVDGEGGVVNRLAMGTRMNGSMAVGATGEAAAANAEKTGRVIGEEVAAAGFNVDFAPDIDVNSNPANPVIGTRSFSDDPDRVAALGEAFARGLGESGVVATYKHFPGHGDTGTDTHLGTATVDKTYDQLNATEFAPFRQAVAAGADLVMTAHVTLPKVDEEVTFADGEKGYFPATMSKHILTDILRGDLGYKGVIVTDALEMDALYETRLVEGEPRTAAYGANLAAKIIEAGADILLLPTDLNGSEAAEFYDDYIAALVQKAEGNEGFMERIDQSVVRILTLKADHGILDMDASGADADGRAKLAEETIGSAAHHAVEADIAKQAVTLLKNDGPMLPLSGHSGNVVIFARDSDHVKTVEYAIRKMQSEGLIDADAHVVNLESGTEVGSANSKEQITIGFYRDYSGGAQAHYTDEMQAAVVQADAVIAFAITYNLSALQPAADQYQALSQILADTHAAGGKFAFLSSNIPYDVARYQQADAVMCAYMAAGLDDDPTDSSGNLVAYNANVVSALESMFGAFVPAGTLPVNVPALEQAGDGPVGYSDTVLYERGFGLQSWGAADDPVPVDPTPDDPAPKNVTPTVTLSKNSFVYNGKKRAPKVTVRVGEKTLGASDYDVAMPANPKGVGRYAVTVTLKGAYRGSASARFSIVPKGTKIAKLTRNKKTITVKWKKQGAKMAKRRIAGYEIQVASNKAFTKGVKTAKASGYEKTSKKVKLASAKKRYVRIRTYMNVGGEKYYSSWSKAKKA